MITEKEIKDLAYRINLNEPTKEQVEFVIEHYDSQAESDPTGYWELWVEQLLYDAEVTKRVRFRFTFDSIKAELMDGSHRYGGTVFCNKTTIKYLTCNYDSIKDVESRFEQYTNEVSIKPNKRREGFYFLNDKQGERQVKLK
jgi:hypothetical protein